MHGNEAEIKLTATILNVTSQLKRANSGGLLQHWNVCHGVTYPFPSPTAPIAIDVIYTECG
jgi:hypothetical protein